MIRHVALTADLLARAIVAAAISYGDDPVAVMRAKSNVKRRALTAVVHGVAAATQAPVIEVARVLRVGSTTVFAARKQNRPQFWRAARAAEEAAAEHIKIHPLTVIAPQPVAAKAKAKVTPQPRLPAAPKRAAAPIARSPLPPKPKPEPEPAREPSILDAYRPAPAPSPHAREPLARLPDAAPVISPSCRSGARTAGKPAPCKVGREWGGDPHEFAFVSEKRAAHVPWSAISRMTGVTELTLRKRYDPTFEGAAG